MTNIKTTKRALGSSVLALFLCFAMLLGTTFAWFTDSVTSANNVITAGNLDVNLYYWDNSMENGTSVAIEDEPDLKLLKNVDGEEILWEPGASGFGKFKVANEGTLALKYRLVLAFYNATETAEGKTLADVLSVYALVRDAEKGDDGKMEDAKLNKLVTENMDSYVPGYEAQALKDFVLEGYLLPGESFTYELGVFWEPSDVDNDYNVEGGLTIDFGVTLLATQATYEKDSYGSDYDADAEFDYPADKWDGTADTSWYDPADPKTKYIISTAEQLAGLAELVSGDTTFAGVTFTLGNDIDLYCKDTTPAADGDPLTFRPIGDKSKNGTFEGTFDGKGKTISNLYQNGWDLGYEWGKYGSYGLFGNVNNATIKNLTISGAESYIEGGDVGGVTGSATGTCVFENITIKDSVFATYNNGNGGIIGWSGKGNYTFKNITLAEDVTLAGLWGSFDSSIGGIVGQGEAGATYNFENVDIACRLDAYNDCTASYDYYNYRMCGMIIGRLEETTTINGVNYPDTSKYNINCDNVTVTYGDWANYHYCEPTPGLNGGRGMRVEPGYAYDGLPADYDHSQCVDNHMNLIPFDQIFGGDQIAVKGLKTYDGVNVIYNNK